jgi:two-component system sensor kinase FixL
MVTDVLSGQILQNVPVMVRRLDGQIERWSRGMQRLYSYSADQAIGKVAHVLLKTEFPKPLSQIEEEIRDTGAWRGELAETSATGDCVIVASEWSLLTDERSKQEAILVFNADVTGRSRDLAELKFLASIVEGSQDAVISKNLAGTITSWNEAAERMFGYSAAEIIGRPILTLFPRDRVSEEEEILSRLRLGQRVDHYETTRLRKDGRQFDVSLTVSPITDRNGSIIGASKIVRDISDQKRLRARLDEVQAELLHVSRLNDMSQMAAGLAHELNQPLAAASSYLAGTRRLIEAGDIVKALDGCQRATAQVIRAGEVIRRLRDFVRKGDSERRQEALQPLCEEAVNLALMATRPQSVKVVYEVHPGGSVVFVDKIQIQQVIVNLVRNAIEAMADSPDKQVTIVARGIDAEFVEVEVSDTGPGIPEEVRGRMFNPFTTTKSSGMGIGLALCRAIVEGHRGTISVDNNPVGGAAFRLTLPAA